MALKIGMVTFDASDPRALAQWWAEQLDSQIIFDGEGYFLMVAPPVAGGVPLGFQLVADPTPGKNKLHLDLSSDDRSAEVARLLAAGATLVAEQTMPGLAWTVLADPEGNQFCISDPHE